MAIKLLLQGSQDSQCEELCLIDTALPALICNLHLDLDQPIDLHEFNVLRHVEHHMQVMNESHQVLLVLNHQIKRQTIVPNQRQTLPVVEYFQLLLGSVLDCWHTLTTKSSFSGVSLRILPLWLCLTILNAQSINALARPFSGPAWPTILVCISYLIF